MRLPGRTRARGLVAAWVLLAAAGGQPAAAADADPGIGPEARARILAHGPWPPPPARDPGNGVAERPEAVALGRKLFFDRRLSPDARLACVSCHRPERAFTDGVARSQGRMRLARNAPTLWNAVHERWWGWDGAADSLWSQAIRPLTDRNELASDARHLQRLVTGDAELRCRWQQVFGPAPPPGDERWLVQTGKALGAFVGSLVSAPTPFDRFRDALERNDARAVASYPVAARRGLLLFVGRGRCHFCHSGPTFSNGEFGDIGARFFVRPGEVDPGRHGGIVAVRDSRFNLLSSHADDPGDAALKTRHVALQHRNFGEFKVPSLRNVALTAPYLHDGQRRTLADVVRHYSELDLDRLHADGERVLEPLHLDAAERRDLVAFLRSLSDPGARRWQPPPTPPCKV